MHTFFLGDHPPVSVHCFPLCVQTLAKNRVAAALNELKGWICGCCRTRTPTSDAVCQVCSTPKDMEQSRLKLIRLPSDLDAAFFAVSVRTLLVPVAPCVWQVWPWASRP